jgi:hypothetical protein
VCRLGSRGLCVNFLLSFIKGEERRSERWRGQRRRGSIVLRSLRGDADVLCSCLSCIFFPFLFIYT